MSQQNPHPAKRQARMNAARLTVARAERRERRRRWLTAGIGVGVLAAIAVTIGVVIGVNSDGQPSTAAQIPSAPPVTAEGRTSNPPWPAPADVAGRVQAAGLPMLGEEGAVEHIHAHLDVLAGGRRVAVPENIGADEANQKISPLHTHDTTGVIHIESPVQASFSLGQVFTEWQVSLAADHLGGLRVGDGNLLQAYVNGTPYPGDPAAIILAAPDEIALVYGTAAQQANPPSTYRFPEGE